MNRPPTDSTLSNADARRSGVDNSTINNDDRPHDSPSRCSGRPAEALDAFRRREASLKLAHQKKPDMVAFKELREAWTPDREHGQIEGVPVGLKLRGRGEAAILGIHTQILRGIDAVRGESCYAVCVVGKYADDDDHGSDGTLVYTGEGGQKKKSRQVEDQKLTVGNAALLRSIDTQLPIRVLRGRTRTGKSPEYFYDGLYQCNDYKYEPSAEGPLVYKFTLVPLANESKERSIVVESARSPNLCGNKRRLLDKRKRDGGDGFDKQLWQNATKPSNDYSE